MNIKKILVFAGQWLVLSVVFMIFFVLGSAIFPPDLPQGVTAEPGPIPMPFVFLVIGLAHALVILLMLVTSRWSGWKLALAAIFAYYGVVTFMGQIETAYFLTDLTVSQSALLNLFLMGIPPALLTIPAGMVVTGKWKRTADQQPNQRLRMPWKQWAWKLALIALAYLFLYFAAGYFIAWKNPDVRAFYNGEDPGSFYLQMRGVLANDPGLAPFQVLRSMLWTLFVLPVIRMAKGKAWQVAIVVGLLLALPMNIGHLLPNPLIPSASVRMSHLIETASSNFVFGLIITWLLHRAHASLADLFGLSRTQASLTPSTAERA